MRIRSLPFYQPVFHGDNVTMVGFGLERREFFVLFCTLRLFDIFGMSARVSKKPPLLRPFRGVMNGGSGVSVWRGSRLLVGLFQKTKRRSWVIRVIGVACVSLFFDVLQKEGAN